MKGQPARRENGARAILSIWRAVCILALAGTLWFIFSHSAQPAPVSGAQSRGVMAFVNEVLGSWGLPGVSEHLLRKAAHFAEFTLEGFLLMLCLRVYTNRFVRHISWPLLGGMTTALLDETIQRFIPNRTSQVTDVWIDMAGVVFGALIALILLLIVRGLMAFHTVKKENRRLRAERAALLRQQEEDRLDAAPSHNEQLDRRELL